MADPDVGNNPSLRTTDRKVLIVVSVILFFLLLCICWISFVVTSTDNHAGLFYVSVVNGSRMPAGSQVIHLTEGTLKDYPVFESIVKGSHSSYADVAAGIPDDRDSILFGIQPISCNDKSRIEKHASLTKTTTSPYRFIEYNGTWFSTELKFDPGQECRI